MMTITTKTKSPTEKQIKFASIIASALDIDFPTGSPDFNREAYWRFINSHIDEYLNMRMEDPCYYDDEMAWYDPWAEAGY